MILRRRITSSAAVLALLLCAVALPAAAEQASQLIVKFKPTAVKSSAAVRLARVAEDAGVGLVHVRTLATGAELAALGAPVELAEAQRIARVIASDPAVAYAEADRRMYPARVPNDTYLLSQQYLESSVVGIGAYSAWDVTTGSPSIVVAVVDTGIRPHVDLAGRILPGYDMVSGPQSANDGDGRDADPSDPGDWVSSGETVDGNTDCTVRASTWHGTSVAGVIAADTNNGSYIAGIDWGAKILPVRVLGKCGGTFSDIIDGVSWAAGLRVPGAPVNANPAQVINLSLGGKGDCPRSFQDAITAAYAHGVTRAIVAAAGNDAADATLFAPANCAGVITVSSTNSNGDLSTYSNSGSNVTISAPGGNYNPHGTAQAIVTISNDGATVPGADTIAPVGGTSFAAPMVSGTVSLMLSVAPNLTPTQVHDILVATAKPFLAGSTCSTSMCGPGVVDASAAVRAAAASGPPPTVSVVEYYNPTLDHFFITWVPAEQANLDAGNTPTRWTRTGFSFNAYTSPVAGTSPVCRYYIPPGLGDSHFFGRGTAECDATGAQHPTFVLEDPAFMQMILPTTGTCPAGTTPIYRVFSNRADANHRYMTDRAVRDMMVSRGWVAEGDGPDLVVMCAPG
jgi:serine protease